MKPMYLEMSYFGPHEHSVIDFRQLDEAPIFLISGDTGAGKSTIFDAMTFALFGSTTNDGTDGRAARQMRSQFAPADQPTEITFYFEQGNQLYKIVRRPEQLLAKKNGTGLTKKAATAKLAIVDTVNGVETDSIAAKPVDVGNEMIGILNLTADQFKKIILLPQNDFSEFLKSKTDQKEAILKKIFGTQLYSDFASKLKERYDQQKQIGEQFNTELQALLSADVWTADEQEQLDANPTDQRLTMLKTFVDQRATRLKQTQIQTNHLTTAVKSAEQALQSARELAQKFAQLAKIQTEYQQTIVDQRAVHQQNQHHLTELEWAVTLKPAVHDRQVKQATADQLMQTQTQLTERVQRAQAINRQAEEALQQFANQVPQSKNDRARVEQLGALIPKIQRFEQLTAAVATLTPQLKNLQRDLTAARGRVTTLDQQLTTQRANLPATDQLQATKDQLTAAKTDFVTTMSALQNQLQVATGQAQTARTTQLQRTQARATATKQQAAAQLEFDQQRGKRQALMIAQLQKELVDGEACVVCGSTDHSHMHKTVDANEAELKTAMAAVDAAQNALAMANKAVQTATEQLTQANSDHDNALTQVERAQAQIQTAYAQFTATAPLPLPDSFDLKRRRQPLTKRFRPSITN
ncbi:AAA family ATPase [Lactiplantibacillus carotarum]|nr:AAA family ATPase [Lactiplantibacillus carotarum]